MKRRKHADRKPFNPPRIAFTVDLTEFALNPDPFSMRVLQRLTGVDMRDFIEELEREQDAVYERA